VLASDPTHDNDAACTVVPEQAEQTLSLKHALRLVAQRSVGKIGHVPSGSIESVVNRLGNRQARRRSAWWNGWHVGGDEPF